MKIATRLKFAVMVPATMAFVVGVGLIFSYKMVQDAQEKDKAVQRIITGMNELGSLVSEYVFYHQERPLQQFLAEHDTIAGLIANVRFREKESQKLLEDIRRDMESMKGSFLKLVSNHDRYRSAEGYRFGQGNELFREVENRLVGRLLVWSRDVASDASILERRVDERLIATQRKINVLIVAIIVVATLSLTMILKAMTRNINRSLMTLRRGTEVVGAGDLDYKIKMSARDEIGELSRSFDHMTEQLQAVTVSKNTLQREIEERKKVEAALLEQREWLRVTLNSIGDAVMATDTEGRISFLNPVASALTGWPAQEAQGRPIQNVLRTVNELTGDPAEDIVKRVMADGRIVNMANHTALVRRDGSRIPIEDSAAPITDSAGALLGVVIVFHDVTEKRRAQEALRNSAEKLRIVADFTHDWEYWRSPDNRFLYVSPSCERITGYSPTEFVDDPELYARIIHVEDRQRVVEHMKGDLFHLDPCELEFRIIRRDGRECWISHVCRPVLDDQGNMLGRRASNRDVNDRKQAEADLQRAHEGLERKIAKRTAELEWRNRELQEFANVAAHDLQEPLRKIQVFGDLLQHEMSQNLSDSARDYLARMTGAATRMQELIKALLAYSRVSTKTNPFERVDLRHIAEKVVDDLAMSMEEKQPVVEIGDLPEIDADPVQISQLLQNLIVNAIRYKKQDQVPAVKISGRWVKQAGRKNKYVELRVQDNGIGFDMRYLDRIFLPFERLHGRGEYEGTGMGLAICRTIAQRHGGSITAESRPGEGATFIVTLPVRQAGEPKKSGELNLSPFSQETPTGKKK